MENFSFDHSALMDWFRENKRSFPWREAPSPYSVWVAEVMLQQTRAAVVVPYFARWMELFPDIRTLAQADYQIVLKSWEGLGYYSRVRNLYEGAKQVVSLHHGILPASKEELQKIKGLGPYTVGAILSFGFGQKFPCVDGNVKRVLSRYFALEEDIDGQKGGRKIWEFAEKILEEDVSPRISEALIELGALICQKKPKCSLCPMQMSCKAFSLDLQELLPIKKRRVSYTDLIRTVLIIECEGEFLVRKCERDQIMADLYEFPFLEGELQPAAAEKWLASTWNLTTSFYRKGEREKQAFTRFRVLLHPLFFRAEKKMDVLHFSWKSLEKLHECAFSSGHRKIITNNL